MAKDATKELVIIGGGPGGYATAFRAADLGLKVTLIDPAAHPGGTCLYSGCIPSKALLQLLELKYETTKASVRGLHLEELKLDLKEVTNWKSKLVSELTEGLSQLVEDHNIEYIRGRASFVSENEIEVENEEGEKFSVDFEHAVIATGSVARELPDVKFDHKVIIDAADALELRDIPENLLVLGGGFIGHELGSAYVALGSIVTMAEPESTVLSWVDQDLVEAFGKDNEGLFKEVLLATKVESISVEDGRAKVVLKNEDGQLEKEFEKVLMAMGRMPNTSGLQLEKAGVETDDEGFIKVNERRKTSARNIYAIGDVAAKPQYANKATYEGRIVAEVIAGKEGSIYDPKAIPCIVATTASEITWCGITETQAKEKGIKVEVARFPWAASGKAVSFGGTNGLTKLIIDPETQRILGGGVAGKKAGAVIADITLAVEMAATAKDLSLIIYPHPTLSETIAGAAREFLGNPTYLSGE